MTDTNGSNLTDEMDAPLGGAVRTVSGLTLVSRVLGLGRDLLLVRIFGNTAIGSAFAAAFTIPNLFRRLFGEGALSAAFLPEYALVEKHDRESADRFATATLVMLVGVTSAITVLIELALLAVLMLAPGDEIRQLSLRLVMVTLPFMPLVCAAAILGGVLHVHGRFAPTAAAPVLLNLFVIGAGILHFVRRDDDAVRSAYIIAGAAVASGVAQVAWSLFALRGLVTWRRGFAQVSTHLRTMALRFGPVLIGLGTIQINALLDMLIAMWPNWIGPTVAGVAYPLTQDANAVLFFSQRLYQFPLGVFGIAVATAIFPLLARTASDPDRFIETLRRGVRLSLFIALPASLGLVLVRTPLTASLFGGGSSGFDAQGVARSGAVLLGYAPAVWAYSLNHVFTRAFYARGDTRTPMRVAVSVVALNVVLNLILIWPLAEAGLAWSTAISAVVQCAALAWLLRRSLGVPLLDQASRRSVARSILMTGAMGVLVLVVLRNDADRATWSAHAVALGMASIGGGGVYLALAWMTRAPELRWLIARRASGS